MRTLVLSVLVLGMAFGTGATRADDIPKGLENLQGNWKMIGLNHDGKVVANPPRDAKLTVKGDQFTFTNGPSVTKGTYKADPAAKPAALDLTITEGEGKGITRLAVYAVKGDTLQICMHGDPKVRPDAVAPKAKILIEIWKKTK